MAIAGKCFLQIPFKDHLKQLKAEADGSVTGDIRRAAAQSFEAFKAVERWANECGAQGGKPYATIVVAAADSTAEDAANADFVCTGAADNTTIQAALDALDPTLGGKVLLLEGTYNLSSLVSMADINQHLQGMGNGTRLVSSASTVALSTSSAGADQQISDLSITKTGANKQGIGMGENQTSIFRVQFDSCLLGMSSARSVVTDCEFTGAASGIQLDDGQNIVHGCRFLDCTTGLALINGTTIGPGLFIANEFVDCTLAVELSATATYGNDLSFIGNTFSSNTTAVALASGGLRVLITSNIFRDNTATFSGSSTTVDYGAGNYIDGVWTGGTADLVLGPPNGLFVAASNATDHEKDRADYLCDGTADDVQIQAAINALDATNGGRVTLSSGTFNISSQVATSRPLTLIGAGSSSTFILIAVGLTGIAMDFTGELWARDFLIRGHGSAAAAQTYISATLSGTVERCSFDGGSSARTNVGLALPGFQGTVRDCHFDISGTTGAANLSMDGTFFTEVTDCYFRSETGVSIFGSAEGILLHHNIFDRGVAGGLVVDTASNLHITDNQFWSFGGSGISLDTATGSKVSGNLVYQATNHGIIIIDSTDVQITDNKITGCGTATDDTYSGIILDGDTNTCMVTGNMVRYAGANHTRYGIRVDDATCDGNVVYMNDLRTSGDTASFSDAGTGTLTTLTDNWT